VPSAAIGRDLEAARATAGELKHPYQVITLRFALLITAAESLLIFVSAAVFLSIITQFFC